MSWRNSPLIFSLWFTLVNLGCGVKGDPLPPEKPPELGRGRPTYKKATEGMKIAPRKQVAPDVDEGEDKDEDRD
ncbi:MAG TPA: hypothetical protein PKC28_01045 [Bdellovibrionales bacterium]|nr:hypothetical protein [Bdellovibrionales bacterium]